MDPNSPLARLNAALAQLDQAGGSDVKQAILAWFQGKPLTDRRAIDFVKQFYPNPQDIQRDIPGGASVRPGPIGPTSAPPAPQNGPAAAVPASVSPAGVPVHPTNGPLPSLMQPQPAGGFFTRDPGGTPVPGGGEAPPVRAVPQGGGQAVNGPGGAGGIAGGLAQAWIASRSGAQPNPVPGAAAAPTQQTPQKAGGTTMASPTGGNVPGAGGLSTEQGLAIGPGGNEDFRLRQVLQSMGVDPYSHGLRTQYLMQQLKPWITARAESLGLDGNSDPTAFLDVLKNFGQGFTTAGRNGLGEARQLAQGILGGGSFNDLMGQQDTAGQQKQYQNLLQLMYGGDNPLIQNAVQNVFQDTSNRYSDASLGFGKGGANATPYSGLFSQFAQQDPQSAIAKILGGLYGR